MERERMVRKKVAASTFARGYLSGIVDTVFDQLQTSGFFFDPVQREVETVFMPWLKQRASSYLEQGIIARRVVQNLVGAAVEKLKANREAAEEHIKSQHAAEEEYAAKQTAAASAREAEELDRIRNMATFLLAELNVAPQDQVHIGCVSVCWKFGTYSLCA